MLPARVSMVTLGVTNMETMRTFYRTLGWNEAPGSNDEFAVLRTSGGVLSLYPLHLLVDDARAEPITSGFKGVTLAVNVESREQVDEAMEVARAAGARIAKEPMDASWGGRSGYFVDPEENYWEIAWAPGTSFDERGGLIWP